MNTTSTTPHQQRIVVFGATSAIAQACARLWLQRGAQLVLVGRHAARLQALADDLRTRAGVTGAAHIHAVQADLDPLDGHAALIAQATALLGSIDVVLIAQGSLPDQRRCEADAELAMREVHTNGVSVIHLAGLLGRQLAAQGHGSLAVISSVAGDRGRQSNYVYGAAKGMVTLYLQGLRNQLYASGVHVLTIKPGFVDTPMTAAIPKGGPLWATPEQVAHGIVRAVDHKRDVAYLPGWWRLIMAIIRAIPEPIFKRLKL
jgi:short-subunit dehydrogenase